MKHRISDLVLTLVCLSVVIITVLTVLTGCKPGQVRIEVTPGEASALLSETIATTTRTAAQAYRDGHIDRKRACELHQYASLALALNEQAQLHWLRGEVEDAASAVRAARESLVGAGAEAARLVEDNCAHPE